MIVLTDATNRMVAERVSESGISPTRMLVKGIVADLMADRERTLQRAREADTTR